MAKKIPSAPSNLEAKISKPKSLRVLMVEDSEDDALLEIRELKKGGYNPVLERVETAAAMKKSLQEKQWDVILCDYNLPKFNAPSAIAILKETNIDIPLIIVSGAIGEETAVECMRLGAHDYIMKGNLPRLYPAVERELKEAETRFQRKQAEEALLESEERFRRLSNATWEGIVIHKEGAIFDANESASKILGYPVEEIIGKNIITFIAPESIESVMQKLSEGVTQDPLFLELKLLRKDKSIFFAEALGRPIRYKNINARVLAFRDITERKQMVEKLRISEENFRRSLDESLLGVLIVTAEGETLYTNQATLEIYGYDNIDELKRTPIAARYTPESYAAFQIRNEKIRRGEFVPSEYEISIMRKNGELRHIHIYRKEIVWDGTKRFQIIYQDITERKQAESELRLSKQQLELTLQSAGAGAWNWDMTCQRLDWSRELFALFGLDPDRDEATFDNWNKVIHPDDLENAHHRIQNAINQKIHLKNEYRIILPDCKIRWINALGDTHYDDSGKPVRMGGICIDITERKRAEEERQQNFERMRKALRATVQSISMTVELKDPYTSGHQQRVSDLARSIATEMGLSTDQQDFIRIASSIHDIGKISLPSEILSKPTKLSDLELSLIKTHSQSGYDILKDIEFPWPVADVVLQHHERMDGSGYPRNLKGNDILIEARILIVADVVEAMASHRPYRPAVGIEAALAEIEKNRGTFYDEAVVDSCLRLFREKGYQLEVN